MSCVVVSLLIIALLALIVLVNYELAKANGWSIYNGPEWPDAEGYYYSDNVTTIDEEWVNGLTYENRSDVAA